MLGITADGQYGPKTEAAVEAFQLAHHLLVDGIAGRVTQTWLSGARPSTMRIVRVELDAWGGGYSSAKLREDAASALVKARDTLHDLGAILTSSGGLRSLSASVGANHSATSMHYIGRALDLFVHSGMHAGTPYIVTRDGDRHFRVYARAEGGDEMTLDAIEWTDGKWEVVPTEARVVDLTAILEHHGFHRITARRAFFATPSVYGASEWWHFQWTEGLVKGDTLFGDELRKLYTVAQLEGTPPWFYRDYKYGDDWS